MDFKAGTFVTARAGHPPIASAPRDGEPQILRPPGHPLLMPGRREFRPLHGTVKPGDRFLLYTDGLTEARSPGGEFFGEERLLRFLKRQGSLKAQELIVALLTEVDSFTGSTVIRDDDITALLVEIV